MLAVALPAWTQNKAGLWAVTSTSSFRLEGAAASAIGENEASNSRRGGPQTVPMCLTPEVIQRYGVILPPSLRDCRLSNVVRQSSSMTADMVCDGRIKGKGTIESSWTDAEHAQGKIHYFDSMSNDGNTVTMGWTEEATAVYKGADCGRVPPRKIPPDKR
jgi:hypothetical protein